MTHLNDETGELLEVPFRYYVFSNTTTGETWSVEADNLRDAVDKLPEESQWDDWFNI